MTTIAWDGVTLAADRCSWSGYVRRHARKVFRMRAPGGAVFLVAIAGSAGFGHAVLQWMRGERDAPDCTMFGVEATSAVAVVVDEQKRVFVLGARLTYEPMLESIFAFGAGQEFAWGALEAGASARRAVEIAAKRGDYAGLGVDCVRF